MVLRYFQSALSASVLATALFFGAAPGLHADDHAKCQRRVEKAEMRLNDAIRHHGERSHDAESRRRDLNAERERCWSEDHGYWSSADHHWHTERDWDHDDHDREHDRHDDQR